ncbi:HAD family phosphatase [Christensenellaceae bacterium OttesenSCG-928-M15]|nr:HAD family phosphatase [Christensenellaceae bacterium OttesenSCG-928-M15]
MKAFLFDLDGTLLDSMGVWAQIDHDFLKKRGFDVPDDYARAVSRLSFPEAAKYTIERFRLEDTVDALCNEWSSMAVYAYGNTLPLKPYAKEYLLKLKECGVKLAIATSSTKALYEPALINHGIFDLFDAICSTDEVGRGKTQPDIFYYTAERLGALPSQCVLFEDIPEAVLSGKKAGMTVYGVYDEASKEHWEAMKEIADGVLYDFQNAPLPAKQERKEA